MASSSSTRFGMIAAVLAVYAAEIDPDDPLRGLRVGERPEPDVPAGWTTVTVQAASLNHHDLWSLRGVGLTADQLPMILGCDAAGVDEDGNEVVVHAVITERRPGAAMRRWTRRRTLLSEQPPGRARRARRRAAPQPRAQAGRALVRGGRLPADGVADRLPDALHPRPTWFPA